MALLESFHFKEHMMYCSSSVLARDDIRYTYIDAASVYLLSGKQGDILQLPGVMYLDRRTNLAIHIGNFPCIDIIYTVRSFNWQVIYISCNIW